MEFKRSVPSKTLVGSGARSLVRSAALAAALALAITLAVVGPAAGQPVSAEGTLLSVSAHAEARRTPDIAQVSAGVTTQAADANASMRQNAEQMTKVIAAIRAAGISERDVQTSGINLNPQYRYVESQPPAITGYQASNTVNVTVRDLSRLGKILDSLVATGANQINGPTFDVDHKESAFDEARRGALDNARQRADMYAKALGLRVRRIVSIDETGGRSMPPPIRMMAMAKADRAESTPVSPGENVLDANIDVVFELGK